MGSLYKIPKDKTATTAVLTLQLSWTVQSIGTGTSAKSKSDKIVAPENSQNLTIEGGNMTRLFQDHLGRAVDFQHTYRC